MFLIDQKVNEALFIFGPRLDCCCNVVKNHKSRAGHLGSDRDVTRSRVPRDTPNAPLPLIVQLGERESVYLTRVVNYRCGY